MSEHGNRQDFYLKGDFFHQGNGNFVIVVLTNFVIVVSASLVVVDRLNACLNNEMRLSNIIQLS